MDRNIRVFLMGDHLGHRGGGWHGVTTYLLNTLPAVRKLGVHFAVAFMGEWHPAAERLEEVGIEPIFLGLSKWSLRSFTAFQPILDAHHPDIVHLNNFKSHLVGRLAAARRGLPTVVHVHDQNRIPVPMRPAQWALAPRTAALVGISKSITRFAAREYRIPKSRCHTIENGIDLQNFTITAVSGQTSIRDELRLPANCRLFAVIGRVHTDKGQIELIRSLPLVLPRWPNACLLIVGDGPARKQCEQLVRELSLADNVIFTGQRSDIPRVLSEIEFSIMPSVVEEGFGYSALESMAMGKPVIASDTGGVRTTVVEGETGLLVRARDLKGLADAVVKLLQDEPMRQQMGELGRKKAAGFSIERHAKRLAALYDELLCDRKMFRQTSMA